MMLYWRLPQRLLTIAWILRAPCNPVSPDKGNLITGTYLPTTTFFLARCFFFKFEGGNAAPDGDRVR